MGICLRSWRQALFDRSLGDEFVHHHAFLLADAERAIKCKKASGFRSLSPVDSGNCMSKCANRETYSQGIV
jgi:hypothetical protein